MELLGSPSRARNAFTVGVRPAASPAAPSMLVSESGRCGGGRKRERPTRAVAAAARTDIATAGRRNERYQDMAKILSYQSFQRKADDRKH